jgi:hypothetical protein
MQNEFIPVDIFLKIIKRWWVITGLMIIGGVFGWIISSLHSPLYESKAILSTSIDFVQSGYLTDIEEDQILNLIGDNLLSDEVLIELEDRLSISGYDFSEKELQSILFIERQGYNWTMRARNENASLAKEIVSKLSEVVEEQLNSYLYHATKAATIYRRISGLEKCLLQQVWVEPSSVLCSSVDSNEIRKTITIEQQEYLKEIQDSHGVDPAVRFQVTQQANDPNRVAYSRNEMILAGMVIGLLIGIILLCIQKKSQTPESKKSE